MDFLTFITNFNVTEFIKDPNYETQMKQIYGKDYIKTIETNYDFPGNLIEILKTRHYVGTGIDCLNFYEAVHKYSYNCILRLFHVIAKMNDIKSRIELFSEFEMLPPMDRYSYDSRYPKGCFNIFKKETPTHTIEIFLRNHWDEFRPLIIQYFMI